MVTVGNGSGAPFFVAYVDRTGHVETVEEVSGVTFFVVYIG
jgi:hypothetical protein